MRTKVEKIEATMEELLPASVLKLISFGEELTGNGVMTVEDSRLKGDELEDKGLTHGLPYFEKRLRIYLSLFSDKGIFSEQDVKRKAREFKVEKDAFAARVKALIELSIGRKLVSRQALDARYRKVKGRSPMTGARIVARAWLNSKFKARLMEDAIAAIKSLDPYLLSPNNGEPIETWNLTRLEVLENTDRVRNAVVCTLCSCYPRGLLGEPPEWYVKETYKERIIKEPRSILREIGLKIEDDVEVKVFDSTADIRYMVLPKRPPRTEGLSEEELVKLVTRDCLIGVGDPLTPVRR